MKLRFAAEDHCLVRFLIDRAASAVHWARHNSALGTPPNRFDGVVASGTVAVWAPWWFRCHGGMGAMGGMAARAPWLSTAS